MIRLETYSNLHDALTADHQRIDLQLEQLRACAAADASCDLDATWGPFEQALLAHLDWEEMFLLPAFDRHAPDRAAAFRYDHAQIRSRLGEIGISIELHAVRQEDIEDLVKQLRDHAAREDETLYQGVDQEALHHDARPSILRRLFGTWERAEQPRATVSPTATPRITNVRSVSGGDETTKES